jgi:hypothetical protein
MPFSIALRKCIQHKDIQHNYKKNQNNGTQRKLCAVYAEYLKNSIPSVVMLIDVRLNVVALSF